MELKGCLSSLTLVIKEQVTAEEKEKGILDRIRPLLDEWVALSQNTVRLKTALEYRERY